MQKRETQRRTVGKGKKLGRARRAAECEPYRHSCFGYLRWSSCLTRVRADENAKTRNAKAHSRQRQKTWAGTARSGVRALPPLVLRVFALEFLFNPRARRRKCKNEKRKGAQSAKAKNLGGHGAQRSASPTATRASGICVGVPV